MKKISLALLIVLAAGFLSGCTTQKPEAVDPGIELSDVEINLQENTQQQTQPEPEVKGASMKTLADFAPIDASQVTIQTTKGNFTIELFRDKAPLTTLNFLTLAKEGFYQGIVFHRIIPGFMAQVGDPLTKDETQKPLWGTGDPGYAIADEFHPELKHDKAGILSMANSGPNTGGSQIFITYGPQPHLDGKHAVFGQVTEGMEVVKSFEIGDSITGVELLP